MRVYCGEIVKFRRGERPREYRKYGYAIVHYTGNFQEVDVTPCDENGNTKGGFVPVKTSTFIHTHKRI